MSGFSTPLTSGIAPLRSSGLVWQFLFAGVTESAFDFENQMATGQVDMIQAVWIDNADNTANFELTIQNTNQRIVARPNSQGLYPVLTPQGALRGVGRSAGGVNVTVIFQSVPVPFYVDAPTPGINVVPALANAAVNFAPLAIGNNVLIAGVGGQSARLFRCLFTFAGDTNIQFTDGPGGAALSGVMTMYAGGSFMLQPSGAPWFSTSAGNALVMTSSAAVNMGGFEGYTQS